MCLYYALLSRMHCKMRIRSIHTSILKFSVQVVHVRYRKNCSDMKFILCYYSTFVFVIVAVVHVCSQSGAEPTCVVNEEVQSLNERLLQILNKVRSKHSESDLTIDENLIENSTEWSRQLAENGELQYSEDEGSQYGEIILSNPKMILRDGSALEQIQNWYNEKKKELEAEIANNSTKGRRYSHLLWEQTRKVGCGACSGSNGTFLTCRYTPKVNMEDTDDLNQGRSFGVDSDTSDSNSSSDEANDYELDDEEEDNEPTTISQPNKQITTPGSKTAQTKDNNKSRNENNNKPITISGSKTTNIKDNDAPRNEKNNKPFTSPQPNNQITSSGSRTTKSNRKDRNENKSVTSAPESGTVSRTVLISAFILAIGVLIFSLLLVVILGVLLYYQTKNYYYCTLN